MNLSNSRRVLKLIQSLSSQPSNLPRYISSLPMWKRSPLDLAMPWWSFAAIDFVGEHCRADYEVFEYGTGGSTMFFSRRCQKLTAVEDDLSWHRSVADALKQQAVKNVDVLVREFDFMKSAGFDSSDYLKALDRSYDIIVVDGQDWRTDLRPICFARAENYIRPGGMIIVDDSWNYPQLRENNRAKSRKTFESVGPCRVGVTSTDVYLY